MAILAARLALPPGDSLPGNDWNHDQTRDWIGPPQPEQRVEQQTAEQDGRQISAEVGLAGVAAMAALPRPILTRLLARDSKGIAIKEATAITIPGRLLAGACLVTSESSES